MAERPAARSRWRLMALVIALAALSGATAELPATLGLTLHDPDASVLNALVWVSIGALWLGLAARSSRGLETLWRLPSALFRGGLAVGAAAIVVGRAASLARSGAGPGSVVSAVEAALYQLGVVALASVAAFAASRSLLRPVLADSRPPVGARDIALRTRVLVAATASSFATAGVLLNVLIDFDTTPPGTLVAFLATAAALVAASALIGSLVGDDTARGVEAVTRRMRELARADDAARVAVPILAADEVGDLTIAASELERRIRQEEAAGAATAERERIARELHDGIAKSMSVLALEIGSLRQSAPDDLRLRLDRVEHIARIHTEELRAVVHEFRATEGSRLFREEVRRCVARYEGASLEMAGDLERLGALPRFEVIRVLDEALGNAQRHAEGHPASAHVVVTDGTLRLMIDDEGPGIGPVDWPGLAAHGHFGLLGMRERAVLLGGRLSVDPRPGGGTRVVLDVPLDGRV